MKSKTSWKKYILLVGVLFLFPLSLVLFFGVFTKHNFNSLPYFGKHEVVAPGDTSFYQLPPFALVNHDAEVITLDSLRGKVWLAAFYATNSPHIRKITGRLLWPNFRYRGQDDIVLVSFTLDPSHDQPQVMKSYIEQTTQYNVFPNKWQYLTGDSAYLFEYYKTAFMLDDPMHTATLWLVDTEGHLRGKYNGNLEEDVRDAIEDIALLKKELDLVEYEEEKRREGSR
jgi:protein SCO1/2